MSTAHSLASPPNLETAVAHHQSGRIAEAAAIYRQVLDADPHNFDALHLLGVVELQRGRAQDAVDLISQSLAGQPENFHALNHLGEAFRALGFLDEAKTCFERAFALNAGYAPAYNNLGNVYQASGRLDVAVSWYQKALEINPNYAEAHTNLGNAAQENGRWDAAIACYNRALEIRPDFPEASFNLGNVYKTLRRYDEAIPHYERTIALNPSLVDAHLALARSHHELGEREQAIARFRRVTAMQPENGEARWGLVLTELDLVHDDPQAVERHRRAFVRGLDELDRWFDGDRIKTGFNAIGSQQPFYLAYQEENNREVLSRYGALCRRLAASWQEEHRLVPRKRKRGKRARLGIVSAHVCDHSVWHAIIKGWCTQLDPQSIELDIFHLGKTIDRETEIAKSHASRFVHGLVRPQQWAEAILAEPLDVLMYPEIGMDPMTAKLANLRLCPVQAMTWGHPETSGLPTIDYYLSGAAFEPPNAQANYSEKLVTLPNFGCYYEPLDIAREPVSLDELGLPTDEPLFICPGTPFKYAPRHDWIYSAIARRLGRCRFAFFKYPLETLSRRLMQRLRTAFADAGLRFEEHVVELPWLSKGRFASLMMQADAYLDTIGFSGFNSAMQAIECGLPVVTREGKYLRGRLASGIVRAMGTSESIATDERDYVELAIRHAIEPSVRDGMRQRIQRSGSSLYRDRASVGAFQSFVAEAAASA